MLAYTSNAVDIIQGSSRTLELTVVDDADAVIDLTGAKIYMSVKSDLASQYPIIQKVSTNVLECEITTPKGGVAQIYLNPSDTQTLDPDVYMYDVWVVLADGRRYAIIEQSPFTVRQGVTVIP